MTFYPPGKQGLRLYRDPYRNIPNRYAFPCIKCGIFVGVKKGRAILSHHKWLTYCVDCAPPMVMPITTQDQAATIVPAAQARLIGTITPGASRQNELENTVEWAGISAHLSNKRAVKNKNKKVNKRN